MTKHFTFFESYYVAVKDLDNEIKAEFLTVLFEYALYDVEPNSATPIVNALFILAKPNLDKSKARRSAGKAGGEQKEANSKQTSSKNVANSKQVPTDKDKDKDKEEDKEYDIGVFSKEEFAKLSSYRSMIKKAIKTQQAVTGLSNGFKKCYDQGYSFDYVFNIMAEKQWTTVKVDWISNNTDSKKESVGSRTMGDYTF